MLRSLLMGEKQKRAERALLAKLGRKMREVTGSPPDNLSDEMKELVEKLESDRAKKRLT